MSRVLVVDDNRDLGKLTSEILKESGFGYIESQTTAFWLEVLG